MRLGLRTASAELGGYNRATLTSESLPPRKETTGAPHATTEHPVGRGQPRWRAVVWTLLIVLASTLGLLCMRLGVFDDSALMLGARLFRAGKLPYRDFYTHYGPLGYVLFVPFPPWIGNNPGLALRLAQAATLAALAALLLVAFRSLRGTLDRDAIAVPLATLALSPAIALSAFAAFGFSAASLLLFVASRQARGSAARLGAIASALMLAAAALTRPAFAAYAGGALLVTELATRAKDAERRRQTLVFVAATAAAILLLWLSIFPDIGPRQAAQAALVAPARLLETGGRALAPFSQNTPLPLAMLLGGIVASVPILWLLAVRPGAPSLFTIVIGLGALAVLLGRTGRPSVIVPGLALAQFGLVVAIVLRVGPVLRGSPALRAAALFGLCASAFGHYFWSRPDGQHLFPLLGLGATSAAFAFGSLRSAGRVAAVALFAIAFVPTAPGRESGFPIASLWKGGAARVLENASRPGARLKSIWPCGEVPAHAAAAVSLADRLAGPSSQFVAFGSNQTWSSGNPVYLFLLSSRLPYTRWYTYDPGLQSSAPIQALMIRDLEDSGSATAVVWRAEQFLYDADRPDDLARRSAFDLEADRLYPKVIARFGNYEVRGREDAPAPNP